MKVNSLAERIYKLIDERTKDWGRHKPKDPWGAVRMAYSIILYRTDRASRVAFDDELFDSMRRR